MSSKAECWLGDFNIGPDGYDLDAGVMGLFRPSDKREFKGKARNFKFQSRNWIRHRGQDERVHAIYYVTTGRVARDRLDVSGYSLLTAKAAFDRCVVCDSENWSKYPGSAARSIARRKAKALQFLNSESWIDALRIIRKYHLEQYGPDDRMLSSFGALVEYMLKEYSYGYPGPDVCIALCLALEVTTDEEVFYDVTDLIDDPYAANEDFLELAQNLQSPEHGSRSQIIILTEGRSDRRILADSIDLLYPHLNDYFRFMDFDGAGVEGGAAALTKLVKAFAGARIFNKVLAIFDNDTAGEVSFRALAKSQIPTNIRVMKLPYLEYLSKYPTIGPTGKAVLDVNGIAGSLELYLGQDVLMDVSGNLTPVQWLGFDQSLGRYQGAVLNKSAIQDRFHKKVISAKESAIFNTGDWTGVETVLKALFSAFHEYDGKSILEFLDQYYGRRDYFPD
jgi:hypothetical protein